MRLHRERLNREGYAERTGIYYGAGQPLYYGVYSDGREEHTRADNPESARRRLPLDNPVVRDLQSPEKLAMVLDFQRQYGDAMGRVRLLRAMGITNHRTMQPGSHVVGGLNVRIEPATLSKGRRGSRPHRIFVYCHCKRWIPVGRIGQHSYVHMTHEMGYDNNNRTACGKRLAPKGRPSDYVRVGRAQIVQDSNCPDCKANRPTEEGRE